MENRDQRVLNINKKSFVTALIMLLALMLVTYALTFVLPAGEYARTLVDGQETVVPGTYAPAESGLTLWKFLLSPFLVLGAAGGGTIIAIIAFLFVIGGAFNALDASGLMRYMLSRLHHSFADKKYRLLAVITLFFLSLGAFVGSFEEVVPLVPIAVALAYSLGWDALVGLGMSLLAVGCGFSTGVCNPFTVGVAQTLAGLPMFSAIWLRLVTYVILYGMLLLFLIPYARRVERDPARSLAYDPDAAARFLAMRAEFSKDRRFDRALMVFAGVLGFGVLLILSSSVLPPLQDLIMPVIALIFLVAGTAASLLTGMGTRAFFRAFGQGVTSILPAVLLILMASSIKYMLVTAKILDTILYSVVKLAEGAGRGMVALLIYWLVLALDLFIASGSAKAFLLMPLIAPLADLFGVSRQVSVLAFAFGDGFSNVLYPTNPVLLISLGIVGLGYGRWARWSLPFQLAIVAVTSGLLLFAVAVGY